MAAGITVPYDTLGLQTADLINNQWPLRPGEPRPKEYSRTHHDYGVHVNCHATQSFSAPSYPAGTAKKAGAFYDKMGVTQHRIEPGFRDTKGSCTLTELPMQGYGTLRQSRRLPGAATLMLSAPALSEAAAARIQPPQMHQSAGYGRPGSGAAQSRRSRASSTRSGQSQRSAANSQRSVAQSQASSVPSWAKRTQAEQMSRGWNFESLPMYDRTNATYGNQHHRALEMGNSTKAAGKSESGFIENEALIASLTRAEY
eukprot:TRINITY_DN96415_c0_g1_i1.p1 TRINITY_DN96415_c0_g1~~TRINITY_DN96415_c0_g1_i1.p1  ORF type:complete len:257 (-),score=36.01 TRINITY_DN96415_c0_g1_i1:218-988(-)